MLSRARSFLARTVLAASTDILGSPLVFLSGRSRTGRARSGRRVGGSSRRLLFMCSPRAGRFTVGGRRRAGSTSRADQRQSMWISTLSRAARPSPESSRPTCSLPRETCGVTLPRSSSPPASRRRQPLPSPRRSPATNASRTFRWRVGCGSGCRAGGERRPLNDRLPEHTIAAPMGFTPRSRQADGISVQAGRDPP